MEDSSELPVSDGRNDGPEGCAEAERDSVAERDAEVADGETEGDAPDSPENSEEEGEPDVFGVGEVALMDDTEEIGDEDGAEKGGRDDPRGEALDEPVDLPRPALDAAEGDEVGGGGETSDPVIDDADKRIRSQGATFCRMIMVLCWGGTIVPDVSCVGEIYSLLNLALFPEVGSASLAVYCLL